MTPSAIGPPQFCTTVVENALLTPIMSVGYVQWNCTMCNVMEAPAPLWWVHSFGWGLALWVPDALGHTYV